jgi:hypothetical protein
VSDDFDDDGPVPSKDDAMALFEMYRAEWLADARTAAVRLYWSLNRPITVDDVRRECPPPRCVDPRVMGAVFSGWTPVGFTNSRRKTCHGRPIRLFQPAPDVEMGQ